MYIIPPYELTVIFTRSFRTLGAEMKYSSAELMRLLDVHVFFVPRSFRAVPSLIAAYRRTFLPLSTSAPRWVMNRVLVVLPPHREGERERVCPCSCPPSLRPALPPSSKNAPPPSLSRLYACSSTLLSNLPSLLMNQLPQTVCRCHPALPSNPICAPGRPTTTRRGDHDPLQDPFLINLIFQAISVTFALL